MFGELRIELYVRIKLMGKFYFFSIVMIRRPNQSERTEHVDIEMYFIKGRLDKETICTTSVRSC